MNEVMAFLSGLGDNGWFWVAVCIFLVMFEKTRALGKEMSLSMLIAFVVGNLILKNLFGRLRPYEAVEYLVPLIEELTDPSFPSGHSMNSFAAATVIFLNNKKWGIAALILAALISFSRLYNLVHYPTDVIVGILIGIGAAILARKIIQQAEKRNK